MLIAHAVSFPECEPACSSAELKGAIPHHITKSYGPSRRPWKKKKKKNKTVG